MLRPRFALFVALLLGSMPTQAGEYGPEWTFTNDKLIKASLKQDRINYINTAANMAAQKSMVFEIKQRCPECILDVVPAGGLHSYRFTYPDGWWFQVSLDPYVIEIQAKHETPLRFKELQARIQKDVFDAAAAVNLRPHYRTGGGHFHLDDVSSFGGDRLLYRNFLVDQANHPEFALGVFGEHQLNAPPLSRLRSDVQSSFKRLIAQFDADPWMSIQTLKTRMNQDVYTSTFASDIPVVAKSPSKYQAANLEHADTTELRYPRPQRSAEDFVRMISFKEGRIEYLKTIKQPIAVEIPQAELTAQQKVDRFYQVALENGHDWGDARKLLPPDLMALAPPAPPPISNYDEIFGADGLVRPQYRKVYHEYYKMLPERRAQVVAQTRAATQGTRSVHPLPGVLETQEWLTMKKGAEQRGRALLEFFKDVQSGKKSYAVSGVVPEHIVEATFPRARYGGKGGKEYLKTINLDTMAILYGPDLVRGPNGTIEVMEDNVGFLGGIGDSTSAREDLLRAVPEYRRVLSQDKGEAFTKRMVAEMRKMSRPPGGEIVLYFGAGSEKSNETLIRQLRRLGVHCLSSTEAKRRLVHTPQGVFLKGKFERGLRAKPVGAIFPTNIDLEDFAATGSPSFMKLASEGKLALAGTAGMEFLSDKNLTPYVEDMIRHYLKEVPILKTPKTLLFANEDGSLNKANFEQVRSNRGSWVIKQPEGLGGKSVWIGSKMTEADFATFVDTQVLASPGAYQAQEFLPISVFDGQLVDRRVHVFVGPHGAVTGDHPWGRSLPIEGDGKVNMTQKGKGNAVFVLDKTRHDLGEVAPDHYYPEASTGRGLEIRAETAGRSCIRKGLAGFLAKNDEVIPIAVGGGMALGAGVGIYYYLDSLEKKSNPGNGNSH